MGPHIVLFLTAGMSLAAWERGGVLERELALYVAMQRLGCEVTIVSYGRGGEASYHSELHGIKVQFNRLELPDWLYARLLPWLHSRAMQRAEVVKTNQIKGALTAMRAAQTWHRPLAARCGYLWSDLARSGGPKREAEWRVARQMERAVFARAARVVVTTARMREYVQREYGIAYERLSVIPNYVLTDWFHPAATPSRRDRVCYIGRLEVEKNPLALVRACRAGLCELVMIGDGPLRDIIRMEASALDVHLTLAGRIAHRQLATWLRDAALYAQVSRHEGHPKTILEAMACGVPVLGADSPGIRELIRHGETGWLCEPEPDSIRAAICELMARPLLRAELGRNARQFVMENFTLERVVAMEHRLMIEIARDGPSG